MKSGMTYMSVLKIAVYESDGKGWAESSKERWEAFSPHFSSLAVRRATAESAASAYAEHYALIGEHRRQRGEVDTSEGKDFAADSMERLKAYGKTRLSPEPFKMDVLFGDAEETIRLEFYKAE